MIRGPAASKLCGMLASHAAAFEMVAKEMNVVLSSRALNPLCEGLIQEGYASKGFYIKAKSCDWGPMAGFVCTEPIFSKEPNRDKQRNYIDKAKHVGAGETQLFVSSRRLIELDELGIVEQLDKTITSKQIVIHSVSECHGPGYFLADRADRRFEPMWALYHLPDCTDWKKEKTSGFPKKVAVMGFTNKPVASAGIQPTGPKAAVAGDYDLFGVWPKLPAGKLQNRPLATRSYHKRPLATAPRGLGPNADKFKKQHEYIEAVRISGGSGGGEHEDMGNVSGYVEVVVRRLNDRIHALSGYSGGNMIHHNDESGNPFTPGQDYPLIFFVPNEPAVAVESEAELKKMYDDCRSAGYDVEINQGFRLPPSHSAPKQTTLQKLQKQFGVYKA